MGFSTVIAWLGVLMVLIASVVAMVGLYDSYITDMGGVYDYQKEASQRVRTDLEISAVSYFQGILSFDIENTGKETILLDDDLGVVCSDVFIDDLWISRDNFTIVLVDVDFEPLLWGPDETVQVKIVKSLGNGTHVLRFVSCNGVKDTESFTV